MTRARVTEWMTGGCVGEEVMTSWKSNRCQRYDCYQDPVSMFALVRISVSKALV
jgi:hypothetical protein